MVIHSVFELDVNYNILLIKTDGAGWDITRRKIKMKVLLIIFSFFLFGQQPLFYPTKAVPSFSQDSCVITEDDGGYCCTREWTSTDWGSKKLYQVKFKNNCSYKVTISYKYRYDNNKLVPTYYEIEAGKTSPWLPAGYEKQIYSYSEE